MNPTIRESCVRAGNTGFIFTLTFILFVLCGTLYDIDADKFTLAHNSALSHDLALVVEYSMEDSDHTQDQDTFAVELLYAF